MKQESSGWTEADVTINGIELNFAQSMTLRVAIGNFQMYLSDPETMETLGFIGDGYKARVNEISRLIHNTKTTK